MNFQDPPHQTAAPVRPSLSVDPAKSRRVALKVAGGVVVMLIALGGYKLLHDHNTRARLAANKPPPTPVITEVVTPGALPQNLTAVGSTSAVHQVAISPELEGRITRVLFTAGSAVKKGDILVQLNDAPEQADLTAMRAQQRLAQLALERSKSLTTKGFVSQAQLDQAQSQYDAATANMAKVQAVIAQKQIRAPFDGVLGVRQIEDGQYLSAGMTITWLTEVAPLYVNFTLPEQILPRLAVGQHVDLSVDAYPGRTFDGRIAVIDPQIMTDTRTIKVQAETDNADRVLAPGMFANVKISLPAQENALTVPETALDYSIYGNSVFVVHETADPVTKASTLTVTRKVVQTGDRANGRVTVTGLDAGDRVVTTGQIRLFEGSTVTLSTTPGPVNPSQLPLN